MIRINLLPTKEAEIAIGRRQQQSIVLLVVAVLALLMIVPYVSQGRRAGTLEREIQDTKRQLDRYSDQVKEVEELDKLRADLKTKLQIIEDLDRERVGPARVLLDLSKATPRNLWLVEFRELAKNATISGFALDNETIADFMRKLSGSGYFFDVDLVETAASREARLSGFKRFIVSAGVDYTGRGGKPPDHGGAKEGKNGKEKSAARRG